MEKAKQKILIIKLSSLGDVIFTVPLANALKDNGFEVSWLVSEKGIDIVKNNTCVDKVFLAPIGKWKKCKNPVKNLVELLKLIINIRKEHFSLAIDAQMRIKSLPFLAFCGAKRRIIAKDCKEFSFLGANEFIPKLKDDIRKHVVDGYLSFAKHLGIDNIDLKMSLPESNDEIKNKVDDLLSNIDYSKPLVALAPATTWLGKHWDKDNWKKLVEALENKYNLIFTGTNKDLDLINYICNNKHLNLAGRTTLASLIEVLRRVDLLVSLDSGTTHLAWATQKPKIVSLFCCTPAYLYAPIGSKNKYIALQSEVCTPCHHKKCTKSNNQYCCKKSPSVEKVIDAIDRLLEMECVEC